MSSLSLPFPLRYLAAAVVLGVALPTPGAAQVPGEPRRFEVPGYDFRPDGAWRKRAAAVRERRAALMRAGSFGLLNAPRAGAAVLAQGGALSDLAITGTFHLPVVLIAYADVPVAYPVESFADLLFSTAPFPGRAYTLRTYYEELSNALVRIEGRVFSPARMDTTAAYYQDNCNGIGVTVSCPNGGRRFGAMLIAALDSISVRPGADTVWNRYDNDGPDGIPNSGDDDGVVDAVAFLHPTVDGSCGTTGIWAHRFVMSAWNNGSPYVTRTPRRGTNGQPIPGQFLVVSDYTIQSQLGGRTGCLPNEIMPIGTIAHETGHVFGLPDLYDTDAASRTEGIGEWGLMGSGNFAMAYSPASFEAWSLSQVGWVTLTELTTTRTVTTGPRQLTDTVFIARAGPPGFYVLVENRQALQSDTAQMNPVSAKKKAPGLLVWLVDDARINLGRSGNRVNTGSRQGVSLMQADGLNQLRTPGLRNRGDPGDSYPGSTGNTRFALTSNPAARSNLGEYLGFVIDRIEQLPGQIMRFRFVRREPSLFSSTLSGARIRLNGVAGSRLEEALAPGDTAQLEADTVQFVNLNRTRARFVGWSNGRPRVHTLVAGTVPDTVSAAFHADHRLLVSSAGGGAVSASAPGNLVEGFFLPDGAAVTLTASPPGGILFAGWEGDTTTRNPVLALVMARPFDLHAAFLPALDIAVSSATSHLLGTPTLTLDERTFLDTFGNRNGSYDVGDYLAFLQRLGLAPPAASAQTRTGGDR